MYKRLNSLGILPCEGVPVYPATFETPITESCIELFPPLTIELVISKLAVNVDEGVEEVKLSPINALDENLVPVELYTANVKPPVALKLQLNCDSKI